MNILQTSLEAIELLLTDNTSEQAQAAAADARIKLANAMAHVPEADFGNIVEPVLYQLSKAFDAAVEAVGEHRVAKSLREAQQAKPCCGVGYSCGVCRPPATTMVDERAELIARLIRKSVAWDYLHPDIQQFNVYRQAADMLEADERSLSLLSSLCDKIRVNTRTEIHGYIEEIAQLTAQQAKQVPMTPQEIRDWWASENKLEDCDMCKLHDFETVVRAVEERLGITQADKPTDWSAA